MNNEWPVTPKLAATDPEALVWLQLYTAIVMGAHACPGGRIAYDRIAAQADLALVEWKRRAR